MNDPITISKKLHYQLLEEPIYQEYLRLKDIYENDKELSLLRKRITEAKIHNKDEHSSLLNEYNSHPIVNNFFLVKEEIKELLQSIKNIISEI